MFTILTAMSQAAASGYTTDRRKPPMIREVFLDISSFIKYNSNVIMQQSCKTKTGGIKK